MLATLYQRQPDTLPSNTVANLQNDGQCLAITIRSCKTTTDPPVPTVNEQKNDDDSIDVESSSKQDKGKEKVEKAILKPIPRPHPLFLESWKKQEDNKYQNFFAILKELSVNIPLIEALEQIPVYTKFMKDIITKKRSVSYESADNIHHYSTVATRYLVEKKKDPGSFTKPCTIGSFNFTHALCDLGASINLMSFAVFK